MVFFYVKYDIGKTIRNLIRNLNRFYCEKNIDKFKNTLLNRNWDDIKEIEDPNKAYKYFLDIVIASRSQKPT